MTSLAPFLAVGELSPGQQAEADYSSARVGWVIIGAVLVGALIWDAQRKVGLFKSNPTAKIYEYGLTLRPVSHFTVPKGYLAFRDDAKFRHGVVQYAKPLSRKDIEAFELEPLDPADPINIRKRVQKCRDEVYEHFARDNGYVLELPDGSRYSLTYSTRKDVEYQMTLWGADGIPTGHLDFNDFDEAAREIGCNGRRVPKEEW